jgi:hypothetical protein
VAGAACSVSSPGESAKANGPPTTVVANNIVSPITSLKP